MILISCVVKDGDELTFLEETLAAQKLIRSSTMMTRSSKSWQEVGQSSIKVNRSW